MVAKSRGVSILVKSALYFDSRSFGKTIFYAPSPGPCGSTRYQVVRVTRVRFFNIPYDRAVFATDGSKSSTGYAAISGKCFIDPHSVKIR